MSARTHAAGMLGVIVGAVLGVSAVLVVPPTQGTQLSGGEPPTVTVQTVTQDKGKRSGYVKRPRVGRAVTHSGKRLDFGKRKDGCVLVPYGDIMLGLPMDDGEWYCPR